MRCNRAGRVPEGQRRLLHSKLRSAQSVLNALGHGHTCIHVHVCTKHNFRASHKGVVRVASARNDVKSSRRHINLHPLTRYGHRNCQPETQQVILYLTRNLSNIIGKCASFYIQGTAHEEAHSAEQHDKGQHGQKHRGCHPSSLAEVESRSYAVP